MYCYKYVMICNKEKVKEKDNFKLSVVNIYLYLMMLLDHYVCKLVTMLINTI